MNNEQKAIKSLENFCRMLEKMTEIRRHSIAFGWEWLVRWEYWGTARTKNSFFCLQMKTRYLEKALQCKGDAAQ